MSSISNFEKTLGQKIAWLLDNGDDTHEMAKYLIVSGAVADPAEVDRLRGVVTETDSRPVGSIEALQATVDFVAETLNELLDDCSQVGSDEQNFVRVSAVRRVLRSVNLSTEKYEAKRAALAEWNTK